MASTVIAGKPSNTVGDKNSTLVLRGSSVKVLWGNKFIDLVKNGKINAESDNILKTIDSIDNVKTDGIYLVKDSIWAVIGGTKILLAGDNITTYISFLTELKEVTAEQKNRALTNIGFYYDTYEQALNAGLTSGLIYILEDNKLYIVKNGNLLEYISSTPITNIETNPVEKLYILEYSLLVDGEEYSTYDNESITIHKLLVIDLGIMSSGASSNYGFKIYMQNGESYLEIDNIIERNAPVSNNYEYIKLYSKHNNFVTNAYYNEEGLIICELLEPNEYREGDYIYIVGSIKVSYSYENNIIILQLNKASTLDIVGKIDGNTITIPAGTTELEVSGSEDSEIVFNTKKDVFEYQIGSSEEKTIIINNGDDFFIDNCKYVYFSRSPFIKIQDNNISILDRSIDVATNIPDETIHTKIGPIKEEEIKALTLCPIEEEEIIKQREYESAVKVGVYSDNFIGLNSKLYNPVFKKRCDGLYPKYDELLIFPEESSLDEKFNLVVPNIAWVKKLLDMAIPAGTIVMWSGNSIPYGWAICDGNNGTPNLIGKFIKASDSAGTTGGNNKVVLTKENLPDHSHGISEITTSEEGSNTHKHTVSGQTVTSSNTSITDNSSTWKTVPKQEDLDKMTDITTVKGTNLKSLSEGNSYLEITKPSTSHNHTVTIGDVNTSSVTENAHTHKVAAHSTSSTSDAKNASFDILPEYYSLIFIIKL